MIVITRSGAISWLLLGFFIGIILYDILDPPPPELVEAISKSEWARRWAESYVSKNLPPEEREKLIDEMAKYIAEKMAERLVATEQS